MYKNEIEAKEMAFESWAKMSYILGALRYNMDC
jgi:hypothetical protein